MNELLFLDCETGGTNKDRSALLQVAAIIEDDGKIIDTINLKMKPYGNKLVDEAALKVQGVTMEDVLAYRDSKECYVEFYKFLARRPKSKLTRYRIAGYNSGFDCDFIFKWFEDMSKGPYAFWDYLQFSPIDILPILRVLRYSGVINTPNTELSTMCKCFGVEIKAHDAMSDIMATRELTHIVIDKLKSGWVKDICNDLILDKDYVEECIDVPKPFSQTAWDIFHNGKRPE